MVTTVWVLVRKDTAPVYVYDNAGAARADCAADEEVRQIEVDRDAVTR